MSDPLLHYNWSFEKVWTSGVEADDRSTYHPKVHSFDEATLSGSDLSHWWSYTSSYEFVFQECYMSRGLCFKIFWDIYQNFIHHLTEKMLLIITYRGVGRYFILRQGIWSYKGREKNWIQIQCPDWLEIYIFIITGMKYYKYMHIYRA